MTGKRVLHINWRSLIAALHDTVMAGLSFIASLYIRLGQDEFYLAQDYIITGTMLFSLICLVVFAYMRLYRGLWRFASMHDMIAIGKAASLAILIFAVCMFVLNRLENVPRSVLFINWMLLMIMLAAPRFVYRSLKDRTLFWELTLDEKAKIPVLLIGATGLAEQFIQDMLRDPRTSYQVVGILDTDSKRQNSMIHRTRIYGTPDMLEVVVSKLERTSKRPLKILIADPNLSGEQIRDIMERADQMALPVARIPRLSEFKQHFDEKVDVLPIAVEDLLGRPQTSLDKQAMAEFIHNKTILVTGAGGSIGSELARQIAGFTPGKLLLLDASEYNLYQIDREISSVMPITPVLGDVRDGGLLKHIFSTHKPDIVFHAAAIKHVPLAEANPEETILTNVFGSKNVADCCSQYGTSHMVMVSTDKAVNPTNVMGATKRLAESYCQSLAKQPGNKTRFITVRFGNVLGSTGSVVPLFKEQIARGGPVTVTHPDMTRYFMTIREAVSLVLQATVIGSDMADIREHILVLDMGKPVKILDLARQMIKLAGYRPDEDIAIQFTGLRPGEKLFEELFHDNEAMDKTSHASVFRANPRSSEYASLVAVLEKLEQAAQTRSCKEAVALLKALVPEYNPQTLAA